MLRRLLVLILSLYAIVSYAAFQPQPGVHYITLTPSQRIGISMYPAPVALEFFSYGCSSCYAFEPYLQQWLKTLPRSVTVELVPVTFFKPGWYAYAKTFYVLKDMHKVTTLGPVLYEAVHQQGKNLSTETELATFFTRYGISRNQFMSRYDSTQVSDQVIQAQRLANQFHVQYTPTIVVNYRYRTNPSLAGSFTMMLKTVDWLLWNQPARS